jgi:YD repeat-containing protein
MGRLINAVSGENSVKVFGYDEQDRIVSLTDSSSSVTSVEYQGLSAHITPENGVGAHAYFLDASGYPLTTVEYAGVGTVRGTMTFVYENCRMVSMFYTKADGSLDPARGFTEIAYDDAGHIVTRTNAHTGRVVTYDYTCW